MPSNRDRALSAAIELVGTRGIRSLTHARVDAAAGLPPGSTSNSFRTRAALVRGVALAMVESETPEIGALRAAIDGDGLVAALTALFEFLVGPNRTTTAARLALLVEAGHDEEVRAALAEGRRRVSAAILPVFAEMGAPDPALAVEVVAATFEGMYLHRIAGHGDIDARAVIGVMVRGLGVEG